jgi:UPF0042 nucleotide-binding protein
MESAPPIRIVLVTGPSGAGRTTAVHALEDLGFEVIDNPPFRLVPQLIEGAVGGPPMALGLDVRNRDFSAGALIELIDRLSRDPSLRIEVLYVDCGIAELVSRYSQSRRRHPLAPKETAQDGIARELDLLAPIRVRADHLIDTTEMSPHDLKHEIVRWFGGGDAAPSMAVSVHSFSYRRGVPRGLDIVMDCRFLQNPHWELALRALDGRDPRISSYVQSDPSFAEFFQRLNELVLFLLPAYRREGKSYLSIGLGCSGGRHRSVAVAEKLTTVLAHDGWVAACRHRELEREMATEAQRER